MKFAILPVLVLVTLPRAQEITKAPDLCTVAGQVINAATGEPLKAVRLALADLEQKDNREVYRALSDREGRFSIAAIAPGRYRFLARHNGFVPQLYQPDSKSSRGATLELSPGQKLDKVLFRLTPSGAIIGRVTDEDGQPTAGVEVEVLVDAVRVESGEITGVQQRELAPLKMAVSNDLGEYRLYGLAPGRYYLAAIDSGIPEFSDYDLENGVTLGWSDRPVNNHPPLYFPGVTQRSQAQKLRVGPGQEVRADFSLRPSKTVIISGRVLGSDGQPAPKTYVTLHSRGTETMFSSLGNIVSTDDQGKFGMKGVIPGAYTLQALLDQGGQRLFAEQRLEVAVDNVSGIQLQLTRGLSISGSVIAPSDSHIAFQDVRVWLKSPKGDHDFGTGEVKHDGHFTVSDLRPTTYAVFLTGLPDGWYLGSGTFGGDEVLDHGLTLGDGEANRNLNLTLARGAPQLRGIVVRGDEPLAGAKVDLAPEHESAYQSALERSANTDQHGGFVFNNLAPGNYNVRVTIDDDDVTESEQPDHIPSVTATVALAAHEFRTVRLEIKTK
jgi:protocatechuate 3,4-dioxygenase beta subunit